MWWWFSGNVAGQYYSGYLIEKSLSVDNVFVWAALLDWFSVPARYQFRVLFWGVFGALLLRAAFIVVGVDLVDHFDWVMYFFGAFLLYTAWRLVRSGDDEQPDPNASRTMGVFRRMVPSTAEYDGQRLFTKVDGRRLATPLLAVLVMVEVTDVLFATDSVPAILAVSTNSFVLFSSNAFAILGLRSLYFVVRGAKDHLSRLDEGIAVILAFVGVKMLLAHVVDIGIVVSLAVIVGVLTMAVAWSLLRPPEPALPSGRCKDGADGHP